MTCLRATVVKLIVTFAHCLMWMVTIGMLRSMTRHTGSSGADTDSAFEVLEADIPDASEGLGGGVVSVFEGPGELPAEVEAVPGVGIGSTLPTVNPGDSDGWAHLALRSLGSAEGEFDWAAAAAVTELQVQAGYEPTGSVDHITWSVVLPELTRETSGDFAFEVLVLRLVLGLPSAGGWTDEVSDVLEALGLDRDSMSRDAWKAVFAK